jgi:hypothetical protein
VEYICNYRLLANGQPPLWFPGMWRFPHNYVEGYLNGVKVYKDGWTGQYVPWSTITYSDAWW